VGIRILAIAGALVLSACSASTPGSDVIYGSHSYTCCVENTGLLSWHAGQRVTLHWQPTPPTRTNDPNPHQIVLSLTLTGPFPSVDALKQATSQGVRPAGVTTITAAPMTVNDRDVVAPASELDLPSDVAPGYYNLAQQSAGGGHSSVGGTVINVIR
jgi:hypothetical protein